MIEEEDTPLGHPNYRLHTDPLIKRVRWRLMNFTPEEIAILAARHYRSPWCPSCSWLDSLHRNGQCPAPPIPYVLEHDAAPGGIH